MWPGNLLISTIEWTYGDQMEAHKLGFHISWARGVIEGFYSSDSRGQEIVSKLAEAGHPLAIKAIKLMVIANARR